MRSRGPEASKPILGRKWAGVRDLLIVSHFIGRWGTNLKMCDGISIDMRILCLVQRNDFSIPKIVRCRGSKALKNIGALTPIFTLPQDPAAPFTVKITNIFKFGIFAVFLMFHRKG